MYYGQRALRLVALMALAAGAWWSVRLARADQSFRSRTEEGVARAAEMLPRKQEYLAGQALTIQYAGGDPTPILDRMAALFPRNGSVRVRLGLAAEIRGDVRSAERWLLDAASVDRMFETRWALANFYFRQERSEEFWKWIHAALEMSYGDRRPAFELCWNMSASAETILERCVPDGAEVAAAYIAYLVEERRIDALPAAALKLAANAVAGYKDLLYGTVDILIDSGRVSQAAQVWMALGHAAPSGVTNPDFRRVSEGHGFDWRAARAEGITYLPLDTGGWRIRLSGNQAQTTELLRQVLAGLQPGSRYRLRWTADTSSLASPSGIEWRIAGYAAPLEAVELEFGAPAESAVLALVYARPRGQVRAEGSIDLTRVSLEPVVR